ncbi:hypothetical protein VXN63_02095 [Marinilactibacillus sp. XAAS-LB27]|uniref:hypothetical protein n=1 Tax=Marinilactibacillus sp. XAAS-LB27 TaxID=3114538 RepID=UPI002E18AC7D|nr:hypothetical protein [Marinilactibacillus sp. XAAS-LB27]
MELTYDWVKKKLNYDLNHICGDQMVFALINEQGYYSNYFLEAEKVPSPYELKIFNQVVKKLTLRELYDKIHCTTIA